MGAYPNEFAPGVAFAGILTLATEFYPTASSTSGAAGSGRRRSVTVKPVSDIVKIDVNRTGLTQDQVEVVRTKINELAQAERTSPLLTSTALRVIGGQVSTGPTNPRGLTVYTFTTGNAEEVPHGLDRVPCGYIVVRQYPQPAKPVADGALADWNTKTAWLVGEAGLTITVVFF